MGEARHERLAVERLELVEPAAVDQAGDDLADLERPAEVGRDRGVEMGDAGSGIALGGCGRRLGRAAIPGRIGRPAVEVGDDRSAERQGVLVVERLVVGDAADPGVDARATELLGADVLAGRSLHQRRTAEEDRPGPADDHGLIAHRRDVRPARRRRAHDERDLRDRGRRQPGLVVEDPAEVIAVGEHLRLERQECPAAVDEVDARQPVLERDFLGPEVLLDRDRVVRAALDGGVVGDDHAGRPLDPADPGDDPRARRLVVVHAPGGERAQLEEGRPRVEESVDPLADRELAALAVPGDRRLVAAGAASRDRRLRSRSSATRPVIESTFARASALDGSSRLRRTGMAG